MESPASGSGTRAVSTFLVVRWLWIVMSFVYSVVYFKTAMLNGQVLRGLLFASFPVLQAVLVSAYIANRTFRGRAQAVIGSAAAALAFAGLTEDAYVVTKGFFGGARWEYEYGALLPGYVWTVLIIGGFAAGTALGISRWTTVQAQNRAPTAQPQDWWSIYIPSATLWIALQVVYSWLLDLSSRSFQPDALHAVFSIGGSFLFATIPLVLKPRKLRRWLLFVLYSSICAGVIVACFILLVIYAIVSRMPNGLLLWAAFPLPQIIAWIDCSLWAALYLWSMPATTTLPAITLPMPARPAHSVIVALALVALSAAGLLAALPVALLTTSPPSLGRNGIGCVASISSQPFEYWFWKGYKGFSSEVVAENQIIFRPAVNASFCILIPNQKYDPVAMRAGYLLAARTWFWLIDPEQWESARTREIRANLAGLIGHDFSSYDELSAWWEENNQYLAWNTGNHRLEIYKVDWQIGHPPLLTAPLKLSVIEEIRRDGPKWLIQPPDRIGPPELSWFGSAIFDPEARLRGLKLYVADGVDILTGERQRRVHDYLVGLTGTDYATADGWSAALHTDLGDPRYPTWQVAMTMVSDLCLEGKEGFHCPTPTLKALKLLTGNDFDSPAQWLHWWQDNRDNVALSDDGRTLVTKK